MFYWSFDKYAKKIHGERRVSLKNGAGFQQLDIHIQKNEFGTFSHTTHKN